MNALGIIGMSTGDMGLLAAGIALDVMERDLEYSRQQEEKKRKEQEQEEEDYKNEAGWADVDNWPNPEFED